MAVDPILPTVGGDTGVWGTKSNDAMEAIAGEINNHESASDPHGDRAYADTNKLDKSQNLSDLASPSAARTALGLGTAALSDTSDFVDSAALAQAVANALASSPIVNQ